MPHQFRWSFCLCFDDFDMLSLPLSFHLTFSICRLVYFFRFPSLLGRMIAGFDNVLREEKKENKTVSDKCTLARHWLWLEGTVFYGLGTASYSKTKNAEHFFPKSFLNVNFKNSANEFELKKKEIIKPNICQSRRNKSKRKNKLNSWFHVNCANNHRLKNELNANLSLILHFLFHLFNFLFSHLCVSVMVWQSAILLHAPLRLQNLGIHSTMFILLPHSTQTLSNACITQFFDEWQISRPLPYTFRMECKHELCIVGCWWFTNTFECGSDWTSTTICADWNASRRVQKIATVGKCTNSRKHTYTLNDCSYISSSSSFFFTFLPFNLQR